MKNIFTHLKTKLALFTILCAFSGFSQPTITLVPAITTGLSEPIQFVNAGDGTNRVFIVQKGGTIRAYNSSFTFLSTFLTISGLNTSGEQGLLSMAFHPSYETNGFFYIYFVNSDGNLELDRYQVSSDPNAANASTRAVVLTIPHPTNANHNGGEMHFGTDGYLYLSTGDGGGGGDVPNNAQNTSVLLGKILRLNVNTSATAPYYTVPGDNPYGNEIYALGLRNPFRWSFDRQTGDMWIGDVGQDSWEEINYRAAASTLGTNYGWRCYEGNNAFNTTVGCVAASNYVFPVHTYPTQAPFAAITGGVVYRGPTYLALQGCYVSADFYSGTFYKIISNGSGGWTVGTQTLSPTGIADFGETENGELYAVSLTEGSVYRVTSDGPLPLTLSSFTGKQASQGVQLKWNTASEMNVSRFEIEYSYNGNIFGYLASVSAKNLASGSSYSYIDKTAHNNDIFYRLKMIDKDGQTKYSGTIVVSAAKIDVASIYPAVVTDGFVYVNIPSASAYKSFELSGINGQRLLQVTVTGMSGKVSVPVNGLTRGIYIAKLSGDSGVATQKIVIQ